MGKLPTEDQSKLSQSRLPGRDQKQRKWSKAVVSKSGYVFDNRGGKMNWTGEGGRGGN